MSWTAVKLGFGRFVGLNYVEGAPPNFFTAAELSEAAFGGVLEALRTLYEGSPAAAEAIERAVQWDALNGVANGNLTIALAPNPTGNLSN